MANINSDIFNMNQPQLVRCLPDNQLSLAWLADLEAIEVRYGTIQQNAESLCEWLGLLHPSERERYEKIKVTSKRTQAIATRARLKSLIGTILRCSPNDVLITPRADGKPRLSSKQASIEFNVSHSGNRYAIALGKRPLGIDLEQERTNLERDQLIARYFHACEQARFRELPEDQRTAAFFRAWTMKEAVLKGDGRGIRGLECCQIEVDPEREPCVIGNPDLASRWKVIHRTIDGTFHMSLACEINQPLQWST